MGGTNAHRRDSFYGRRKGRPLTPGQQALLEAELPRLLIDCSVPSPERPTDLFDAPVTDVRLEIGIGGGEHLVHAARTDPERGFIGVEPFLNGLAKAVAATVKLPLANIRLHDADAGPLLDWLPAASLGRVDLLYPDPWPKRRHFKRRFVNQANLDRIVRALKPGGVLRFATDIESYAEWTLNHVWRHNREGDGGLVWTAERADDWRRPFPDWPGTRYEAKALSAGRRPFYFTFRKPQ